MIKFDNITKIYGDKTVLDNLSLEINEGEIFGLIGHNGAGKTTAIKILVSAIEQSSGKVYVNGKELETNRDEIKKNIGYVSDSPDLFLDMYVGEFWKFMGKIYGVSDSKIEERSDKLAKLFSIEDNKDSIIAELSHGMRQKTFIIGALISNPGIWILDEPMTGLDPQSSFNLKELMKEHSKAGKTVLFSTHVLEVAEKLCDRIGILRHGKLIFVGTMEELKKEHSNLSLEEIYLEIIHKYETLESTENDTHEKNILDAESSDGESNV